MSLQPLDQPFVSPDYQDHFVLTTDRACFDDVEHFGRELALRQPGWLIRVSMGLSGRARLETAVGVGDFPLGNAIGNWKVVERTDTTITFAEDMKIMAYRLTYTWVSADTVTAETEVVQQSRLAGPIYWRLATPMHRRFLSRMLRNAAGGAATGTATVKEKAPQ